MRVEDITGEFSQAELQELENFVRNDLLSTDLDIDWLDVIRIREDARSGYRGYWQVKVGFNDQNPNEIDSIVAIVVLNYFYVKFFEREPLKRLDKLKEVLAHEYGHHWTLSYLLVNQVIQDINKDRIPIEYYQLRGLSEQDYAPDYSKEWHNCDKEIIAEDYRVLFAQAPHNENHRMINNPGGTLALPNNEIKIYIENLNTM